MGCKHHAFDHRQLTAVDRLIETEVAAAAGNKCTQLIPVSEIPQSPLFGPHDLIPLPIDDTPSKVKGKGWCYPKVVSFSGSMQRGMGRERPGNGT